MLLGAVQYARYGPLCKNWTEVISGLIGPEMEKVWNGTESAKEAMTHLKPLLVAHPPETR